MTDRELMQQALEALERYGGVDQRACDAEEALRERLAQPEQEPYCYHDGRNIVGKKFADHSDVFPLYTAPQPRQWQGLTEEDLFDIAIVNFGEPDLQLFIEMGKLVQEELKEKNA